MFNPLATLTLHLLSFLLDHQPARSCLRITSRMHHRLPGIDFLSHFQMRVTAGYKTRKWLVFHPYRSILHFLHPAGLRDYVCT